MRLHQIIETFQSVMYNLPYLMDLHFDLNDDGVLNYWNNTPNINYPSVVFELGETFETNNETGTIIYRIRVYVGERRKESENNDWNTWETLALHLQALVEYFNDTATDGTIIDNNLTFTPTTQVFADNLAVVQTTFTIETPFQMSACGIINAEEK